MNTCPKCGAEFPRTVRICPNDGTVLEEKSSSDPRIGTTLDGKYKLESALGQGGMGTIYRATHLMLDKPVALKLIKADLVTSPEVVRRFQREARAASNLNHPHIAAAYDLGQTQDGTLYIAMELVNGPSLKDVIRSTGPLDPARIGRIMRQVASALAAAHKHGIIHRDLKPHNIMLATAPGEIEVAKLLDFGIAKTFDESSTQLTATGFVLGTPQYMSPEQAAGRPIDGRSDLYSLGIILFEMLVGEVPFNDPSTPALLVKHLTEPAPAPSRRRPDLGIPPALEAVALRCLEKDPAARFQTADEFAAALDHAVGQAGAFQTPAELAPTVVVSPPFAPTATAPASGAASTLPPTVVGPGIAAASTLPPTVISTPPASGQKTAQVYSPVASPPTAGAPAAVPPTSPSPIAPPPASVAAPPRASGPSAVAPSPSPPPPASLAATSASTTPAGSPLSRNIVIVGAFVLLLIAGGAYVVLSGGFGRSATDSSQLSSINPPPASTPDSSAGNPPASATPPPTVQPTAADPAPAGTPPAGAGGSAINPGRAGESGATGGARRGEAPSPSPRTTPDNAAAAAPPVTPPAKAENPAVVFRCSGASNVCASLRTAMANAFEAQSIVRMSDPGKADILAEARVEVVSERTEQMFGQTFVTTTYSVELSGDARTGESVPMPAPTTFSFDARVGQERLDGQMRVVAASAAERIRAFWKK